MITGTEIDDAAVDVVVFAKTHDWPKENTPEFFEFAEMITRLECAIRNKYPKAFSGCRK